MTHNPGSEAVPSDQIKPQAVAEQSALQDSPDDSSLNGVLGQILVVLTAIKTERWFLAKTALVALVVATALALAIPKKYEATTRFVPEESGSPSLSRNLLVAAGNQGGLMGAVGNVLGEHSDSGLFIGLLQGRELQDELVARFNLKSVYHDKLLADTRKTLAQKTAISEDTKSGIVSITVTDNDAVRAANMATAYVDLLNKKVSQLNTSAARRERVFLETHLQALRQQLDEASIELSQFSSKNKTIDPQVEGKAVIEALSTLEGQLIAAQAELQGLQEVYGPQNNRVRVAEARVRGLQSKLAQLDDSSKHGKSVGPSEDAPYPSLTQLPLLGRTYYDLFRTVKVDEAVYELLTKQLELAKVQEARETHSVKIVDAAEVPERKSFPPRMLIVVLLTLLSVLCALGYVLLKQLWASAEVTRPYRVFTAELRKL